MTKLRKTLLRLYWFSGVAFFSTLVLVRCGTDPQGSSTAESASFTYGAGETLLLPESATNYAAPVDMQAYNARTLITQAEIERRILTDLRTIDRNDQRFTRYFTLTNLYNGGTPDAQLAVFRHALSKMLNSLSYEREVTPPRAIDAEQTIFRADIRNYSWSRSIWESIASRDPYAVFTGSREEREIRSLTAVGFKADTRADWFAVNGLQPPLYHIIMQIPGNIRTLEFDMGVNVDNNIRRGDVLRGAFNASAVSQQNRMIEVHQSRFGTYWKSYDFLPSGGRSRRNLFEFALDRRNFGGNGFDHAGGEMIYQLPNGLSAYVLTDQNGTRINKGPTEIVADPARPDMAVVNGLSCYRCHHSGMIPFRDNIREHFDKNGAAFSRQELDIVRELYQGQAPLTKAMTEYNARFASAISKLGFPYSPRGGLNATNEPIYLLARQFEAEIPVTMAAAELGLDVNQFQTLLGRSRFLTRRLGVINAGANLKRDVFEDNFGFIVEAFGIGRPFVRRGFGLTDTGASAYSTDGAMDGAAVE